MTATIIGAGIACLLAAILGGGIKAFGTEIPHLESRVRQILLGVFGGVLLVGGVYVGKSPEKPKPPSDKVEISAPAKPIPVVAKALTDEEFEKLKKPHLIHHNTIGPQAGGYQFYHGAVPGTGTDILNVWYKCIGDDLDGHWYKMQFPVYFDTLPSNPHIDFTHKGPFDFRHPIRVTRDPRQLIYDVFAHTADSRTCIVNVWSIAT